MSSRSRRNTRRGDSTPDWTHDVALAPDAAIQLLELSINLPKRRALGLFKLRPEFVGWTADGHFEIWERQRRAVHASGRARPRRGGTRLEVEFGVSRSSRVLLALFFALYVLVALGLASQPPEPGVSALDVAIVAGGAVVVGLIFFDSTRRQRRDLTVFLDGVFSRER